MGYTERPSKEGILEPYKSSFVKPDFFRFQRVLRKITRGLYYRVVNRRLPDDYAVLVNPFVKPDQLPNVIDRLRSDECVDFQSADEYEVFKFMSLMKTESRTEWLMLFYNWAVFHTWTLPKGEVIPGETGMPYVSPFKLDLI
jgi:hypothetical protein